MSRFRMNVIFVFVHEAPAGHGTFSADFDFSVFRETMTLTLDQVWFYFLLIRKEIKLRLAPVCNQVLHANVHGQMTIIIEITYCGDPC